MKSVAAFIIFFFTIGAEASDKLPFSYLNQYYTYENIDDTSFKINGKTQSFNSLDVIRISDGVQIVFKDIHFYKTEDVRLEIINKKNKIIKDFLINSSEINEDFKQNILIDFEQIKAVCFISKNEFTTKKICKIANKTETKEAKPLKYSANNVLLNTSGQIVLNDKSDSVVFKVKNSDYLFELTTVNKKIIANRAYKLEKSHALQVDFVELGNPDKYNFKKEINLSDTYFEINIDNLITVYQDIAFPEEDLLSKPIDYEFKDWKVRKYNKLGIEPIGLYSYLLVESTPLNAKIVSDLSKGIKIYLTRYTSTKRENYSSLKLVLLQLRNDANSNTMNNKDPSLMGLEIGTRYYQTSDLHYDLNIKLEELFYAENEEGTSTINIVKALTPTFSGTTNFILYEIDKLRLHFLGGMELIGPSSIPSGQTQLAFDFILGSQVTYKVRGGRLYYGLTYSSYKTSNSAYSFTHKALEHKIGFYYLF